MENLIEQYNKLTKQLEAEYQKLQIENNNLKKQLQSKNAPANGDQMVWAVQDLTNEYKRAVHLEYDYCGKQYAEKPDYWPDFEDYCENILGLEPQNYKDLSLHDSNAIGFYLSLEQYEQYLRLEKIFK